MPCPDPQPDVESLSLGGARPAVSVILCSYDRERSLKRAIRSVLAQTLADFELIVVDDGSTDSTAELVLRFARLDSRIAYLRHAHRGLPAARNAGIRLARGKWVTFIDSDDAYAPGHLSLRLRVAAARRADAVFGGARLVGPRRLHYVADMDRPGRRIDLARCHIGGTLFVRRTVLLELGGFRDLAFAEDHELMQRIEHDYRVVRCSRRTYVYHLGGKDRLGALSLSGNQGSNAPTRTSASA